MINVWSVAKVLFLIQILHILMNREYILNGSRNSLVSSRHRFCFIVMPSWWASNLKRSAVLESIKAYNLLSIIPHGFM